MAALSVLYVGPESGTSRHRRDAFARLGHRVQTVDPRSLLPRSPWVDRFEWHVSPKPLGHLVQRRLDAAIDGRRYDLAFVDGGSLVTPAAVRALCERCTHVVGYNHDDPYGPRDGVRYAAFREAVRDYDLVVVVRPSNVDAAKRLGARRVLYHPFVADEVAHAPRPLAPPVAARWAADVVFVGTWMPERGPFMAELLQRGVALRIHGSGWNKAPEWPLLRAHHGADYLDGDDYAHAVQCARISLGLLSKGNGDRHTTRSLEIPSLGGLLCAERTDEHRAMYREGEEAVFWSDAAECAERCRELLADEPRRQAMARRGRARFLANGYTSENLVRKTIGALG